VASVQYQMCYSPHQFINILVQPPGQDILAMILNSVLCYCKIFTFRCAIC